VSRPIPEDMPLVEPGVAWPRFFWAPMIALNFWAGKNLHPAEINFGMQARGTYKMPPDFTTLDELYLVMRPEWTGNYNLSITISFGKVGELYNVHTQNVAGLVALVLDTIRCYDLVPVFPALLALLETGDHLMVNVNNQTAQDLHVYGLDGRYS